MTEYIIEKSGRRRAATTCRCDICNSDFLKRTDWLAEKNYCSRKCSGVSQQTTIDLTCDMCAKVYTTKPSVLKKSKSGLTFCSRNCKDKAQSLAGGFTALQPDHYGTSTGQQRYRAIAYAVFPKKCMACSHFDEYPELMQVHHIDSDRTNNDISNLAVLCPTHHWAITIRKATMGSDRLWIWVG